MAQYSVSRSNVTLNTANDWMTFISPTNRRIRLVEIEIGGMGTASAANELNVARSTGGTTGGGALTSEPLEPDSAAAGTLVYTTWSAQPTVGNSLLRLPVNANGGINRWVARPGSEIIARNLGQLSLRPAVGTSNISGHVIYEEF